VAFRDVDAGAVGIVVSLEPGGFQTTTASDGTFTLEAPPGSYQLSYSAPGFSLNIPLVYLESGGLVIAESPSGVLTGVSAISVPRVMHLGVGPTVYQSPDSTYAILVSSDQTTAWLLDSVDLPPTSLGEDFSVDNYLGSPSFSPNGDYFLLYNNSLVGWTVYDRSGTSHGTVPLPFQAGLLAWSRDSTEFAALATVNDNLYRVELATAAVTLVATGVTTIEGFSADGTLFFDDSNRAADAGSSFTVHNLYRQVQGSPSVTLNTGAKGGVPTVNFSGDGQRVAYFGDTDPVWGTGTLYTLASGASTPTSLGPGCLVPQPFYYSLVPPFLSPDGSHVVVSLQANGVYQGLYAGLLAGPLVLIDANGQDQATLFSADGSQLAYLLYPGENPSDSELAVRSSNAMTASQVIAYNFSIYSSPGPLVATGGNRFIFATNASELYSGDFSGAPAVLIDSSFSGDLTGNVAHSPDGTRLVFLDTASPSPCGTTLFTSLADGSGRTQLAVCAYLGISSPDGGTVSFTTEQTPSLPTGALSLINFATGAVTQLASQAGSVEAWSADSSKLAFEVQNVLYSYSVGGGPIPEMTAGDGIFWMDDEHLVVTRTSQLAPSWIEDGVYLLGVP
jgi:Tol biopolymer transport system component